MKTNPYPHVAARVFGPPLAMSPAALKASLDQIGPRLLGQADTRAEAADDDEDPVQEGPSALHRRLAAVVGEVVEVGDGMAEYARTADGIAVIPIVGTLVNRFDWLSSLCGLMSYDTIGMALDAALADPQVRAILLDVDSPGGEAAGMLDLADRIRAAAQQKPVWAVANALAASAGYGLAAAASRLVLPRLAMVGSIGVVAVHVDRSQANQKNGLAYTAIYAGAQKIDGWAHAPLAAEAKDRWQADIDKAREKFAVAIARFRGLTLAQVLATEAAVYSDADAVAVGLADAVQTFDDALAELAAAVNRPPSAGQLFRGSAASPKASKEVPMAERTTTAAPPEVPAVTTGPAAPVPDASAPAPAVPDAMAPASDAAAIQAQARAYAKDMADLCLLAGKPDAAIGFVSQGLTLDQARAALLEARAADQAAAGIATARPGEAKRAAALGGIDYRGIYANFNRAGGASK
jgi:signal peptide peptidase SppA